MNVLSLNPESLQLAPSSLSKREIEDKALTYITELIANQPTLQLLEGIEQVKAALAIMEKQVRETAKSEYRGVGGNYGNLNLSFKNGRRSFDYSRDLKWNRLKIALDDREEYLKALKSSQEILDTESGEVITEYPPIITYGAETISVTLR